MNQPTFVQRTITNHSNECVLTYSGPIRFVVARVVKRTFGARGGETRDAFYVNVLVETSDQMHQSWRGISEGLLSNPELLQQCMRGECRRAIADVMEAGLQLFVPPSRGVVLRREDSNAVSRALSSLARIADGEKRGTSETTLFEGDVEWKG